MFGTFVGFVELLSLASFVIAPPRNQAQDGADITIAAALEKDGFAKESLVAAATDENKKAELLDRYSNSKNVVPNVFTYMVVLVLSFESLVCGK